MTLSGWCSGPLGSRPKCAECRSHRCSCDCHADQTCPACLAPVLSDTHHAECIAPLDLLCGESRSTEGESVRSAPGDVGAIAYNGRTSQDGPRGSQRQLRTGVPGPRPTLVRSAEL